MPFEISNDLFELPDSTPTRQPVITYKNRAQRDYARLMETKTIVFGVGSAGTGKTFLAAVHAAQKLSQGEIERIIVCRPAVPAGGEQIGFLPGELNDKMMPYLRPIFDAFRLFWPQSRIKTLMEYGKLEIVPLAFMRGRTFADAMVIADEIQNATTEQLLMLLTRLGEGSNMVITGDPTQSDLRGSIPCFDYAREKLSRIAEIGFVEFTEHDVVRHPTVQKIIQSWHELEDNRLPEFLEAKAQ